VWQAGEQEEKSEITPRKYANEEKAALIAKFLAEYRESRCSATEFSRKKGITEATLNAD